MDTAQRQQLLHELAAGIARRRLAAPARLTLDVITPLGFLAGQVALFARPLLPTARWRSYAAALDDEASWRELRNLLT